jgi:uncharacterized SAM-binding protein YcdF (DUF218 family)
MTGLSFSFLMPPTIFIVLCLIGALLALRYPLQGIRLALASSLLLYISATPVVAEFLSLPLVTDPPTEAELHKAQAIVVLGAGIRAVHGHGEPGPDELDALSTERLAWAAEMYHALSLPVAVTGGRIRQSTISLGSLMKEELERNFRVPVSWTEESARTTFENAEYTARMLKPSGIDRVIVVTNPWHMERAIWSFNRAGLQAIPSPLPPRSTEFLDWTDFFPSLRALQQTFYDLHELLGLAYYRLRY